MDSGLGNRIHKQGLKDQWKWLVQRNDEILSRKKQRWEDFDEKNPTMRRS